MGSLNSEKATIAALNDDGGLNNSDQGILNGHCSNILTHRLKFKDLDLATAELENFLLGYSQVEFTLVFGNTK